MKLVLGIDEAGYGPNMGPLVIACTAWFCRTESEVNQWSEELKPEFSSAFSRGDDAPIALGDSKQIYVGKHKLDGLDRTVGFFSNRLHPDNILLSSRFDLIKALDGEFYDQLSSARWFDINNALSEQNFSPELIHSQLREQALLRMDAAGVRFLHVQLRIICEPLFNELVSKCGNKASVLTDQSLQLARNMLTHIFTKESSTLMATPIDGIEIYFDKHGGRSKYAAALNCCWPDWYFQVLEEGRAKSRYCVTPSEIPKHFHFVAEGDHLVPCGLASIFAKWTREILMLRLNAFWQEHSPGLRPTAGYPLDAKRFADEIDSVATGLKLNRTQWWRCV